MDTPSDQAIHPLATIVVSAIALVGFTLIYIEAGSFGAAARLFPRVLSVLGGVCAAGVLVRSLMRLRAPRSQRPQQATPLSRSDLVISYIGPVVYAVGLYVFGFWIASVVCLAGLMLLLGERRYFLVAAITVGTLLAIYVVFELGFSIRMPKGLIIELLQG